MSEVKSDASGSSRRPYHSPKRAQAALERRRRMRAAAEKLFMRDGYEPTTMLRIAAEARVAERTLYLAYPSKAALLGEIIRVGVRGGEGDQPLTQARRRGHANIRADMGEFAAALRDRGALQAGLDVEQAAAILFAICANETIFLRLTDECGWTPDQYAELIENVISTLLVEPDPPAG